jgi:cell wall-associated NlpC family hydrolase
VTRDIWRKTACIVLCLAIVLFWSSISSAGRRSRASSHPKKKIAKTMKTNRKANNYKEISAFVNIPSSDIFARNSAESERVTQVLLGDEFIVVRRDRDWAYGYIPSQKGYRGWIRNENISFSPVDSFVKDKTFVQVKNAKARITFRDGSFINVYAGTRLPLLRKDYRRYEVVVPDGSTGYLPLEAAWVENERSGKEVTAEDILKASIFHGSDYKWGGITTGGMDCSGFVYTAFRLNGIYLKRDSYMQAEEGADVPVEQLRAGDLVFFKSEKTNRISHVGIYIGNGNFIHSSRGKRGVAVSSLSDDYFKKHFAGARRVLPSIGGGADTIQDGEGAPAQQNKNKT